LEGSWTATENEVCQTRQATMPLPKICAGVFLISLRLPAIPQIVKHYLTLILVAREGLEPSRTNVRQIFLPTTALTAN